MRKQCKLCPWRTDVDPFDIPDGYSVERHRKLESTVADPGSVASLRSPLRFMSCHEFSVGAEMPCVGWLAHQLGPGNNIALRMRAAAGEIPGGCDFELVGEQHETLDVTLPGGA